MIIMGKYCTVKSISKSLLQILNQWIIDTYCKYWNFLNNLHRRVEFFKSIFLHLNISTVLFVLPESEWSRQNTPRPRLPVLKAGKNCFCALKNALQNGCPSGPSSYTWGQPKCACTKRNGRRMAKQNKQKINRWYSEKSAHYLKEENEKLLSTSWNKFNEGN